MAKRGRARRPEDLGRISEPVFRPAGTVAPDVTGAYGGPTAGLGQGAMGLGGPPRRGKNKGRRKGKGGAGGAFGISEGGGGGRARGPRAAAPTPQGSVRAVTSGGRYSSTVGDRRVPIAVSTKTPRKRRTGKGR